MDYHRISQLVERVQQNDSDAFAELYSLTYQKFYYFALTILHNEYDVQDILQDVYLQILQSIHVLKNTTAFIAWAERIIYHDCLKFKNKQVEIPTDENIIYSEGSDENPLNRLVSRELSITLLNMIYELDPVFRTTVYLRYVEQMKLSEIAEVTDCPVGTVKSRLHLAKKQLHRASMASERKGILLYSFWFFPIRMVLYQIPYLSPHDSTKAGNILKSISQQCWDTDLTYQPQPNPHRGQFTAKLIQLAGIPIIGTGLLVAGIAVSSTPAASYITSLEVSPPYVQEATVTLSLSGTVDVSEIVLKDNTEGITVATLPADGLQYHFKVPYNGTYSLEVLNEMSLMDSITFQIDSIDIDEPFITGYSYDIKTDTLQIGIRDSKAGIDYSKVEARTLSGNKLLPKSMNTEDGILYYPLPKDDFILSLADFAGNESEHLVKVDSVN